MHMNFKNKTVTVVGLGRSGFAAAKFLNQQKALVRVTENSEKKEALENAGYLRALGIEVETGGHTEAFVSGSRWVVTSPGVSKQSPPLVWARQKKIPVISEVELASYFCRGRIVAVTGSNGKTTTCHLLYRVLKEAGRDCVLCGNVGHSFLDAIPAITRKTIVVLELSSFQLEDCPQLKPSIAVILNISANHLDRHGTLENYSLAKENIFRNQDRSDFLILNAGDDRVRAMAKKARSRVIFYGRGEQPKNVCLDGLRLKGDHNRDNVMACVSAAFLLRIGRKKIQKALEEFTTLAHRLEPIGEFQGVKFINDSKSTTVESTRAALLASEGPVILIAGGRDKSAAFADVESLIVKRVKLAVLYGEAREKIRSSWKNFDRIHQEADFRQAVRAAFKKAEPGDSIVLSPMCASFDQFSSFEERGEVFKRLFRELVKENGAYRP
jgi:UDP-N-acetylmuramoylalanine--D-glutamate ligase